MKNRFIYQKVTSRDHYTSDHIVYDPQDLKDSDQV